MASEKFPAKIGKKDAAFMGIILVLAVVLAFTLFQNNVVNDSQQKVMVNVENVYRNLTESDVEVVSVKDEGYLYKILLNLKLPDGDTLREVYATKDGKYLSESGNVIETTSFIEKLGKEKNFAECLKTKGLFVVGQKTDPSTIQQLLVIGNFASRIYFDCTGTNLQVCQQQGITVVPTIFYNGMNYTGIKNREWLTSLTACEY